eukprot:scaffold11069_cov112-Isochrysis_galbana.AAC.1
MTYVCCRPSPTGSCHRQRRSPLTSPAGAARSSSAVSSTLSWPTITTTFWSERRLRAAPPAPRPPLSLPWRRILLARLTGVSDLGCPHRRTAAWRCKGHGRGLLNAAGHPLPPRSGVCSDGWWWCAWAPRSATSPSPRCSSSSLSTGGPGRHPFSGLPAAAPNPPPTHSIPDVFAPLLCPPDPHPRGLL